MSSNRSPRMRERLRACCAATIDEARVAVLAEAPELKWAHGRQASWLTYGLDHLKTECAALVTAASQIRASAVDAALRQLARRIAEATAEAAQARRAEGKLEFHDLLVLARDLLTDAGHGAAVRNALHQQYRRLLLDEFQDTDPIQIELAVRIAASRPRDASDWADVPVPPGSLFLVGDPKQSIYRFRRADIATYLRAQQRIGDPVILAANFRTTEPVLTWINHVFGQLISAEDGTQPAYIRCKHAGQARPRARPWWYSGRGIAPRQAIRRRTARPRSRRRGQLGALDAHAADRNAYLKLADNLEGFLAQLRGTAATATVEERRRVLRLLVKDVLIGPEKIAIRHRIPVRNGQQAAAATTTQPTRRVTRAKVIHCVGA